MQDILIQSCQLYYDYLLHSAKGVQNLDFIKYEIRDNAFVFLFKNKIVTLDSVVFQTLETSFFLDDERVLHSQYYDDLKRLEIEVSEDLRFELLQALQVGGLKIYSDLKFLVLNLKNFFLEFTPKFPEVKKVTQVYENLKLSIEQQKAFSSILNSGVSYVWGPPGCGKTQFVLFEALMYFLQKGEKVCVLAPTNSALDIILESLIFRLDSLEIDRSKILRFGMPSAHFMANFKEVCDPNFIRQKNQVDLFVQNLSPKDRIAETIIFAMTIDGFIKRYAGLQIKFSHIFLDECAFTPLIKALALCVDNTPLTLFGDHKQLSPICEMPEKDMMGENSIARLWNFSALFLEDFFFNKDLLKKTITSEPQLSKINMFALNETYRYGNNLAQILNTEIYRMKNPLIGLGETTDIFYVDIGSFQYDNDLSSTSEANGVLRVYQKNKHRDCGIITPFKKQKELIVDLGVPQDAVTTIHSSQGREFDIVIFSPVRLHYYLTDSRNLEALFALNVAISRLKKQLIIVCDYHFWIKQKNQFLCKILEQAFKYIL
ncbi:hypothetical protein CQA57_02035 [Helicobacter anseris]|uniref:RNA helicase n=1 Tax=Helicobacter anseris TaxID=375926 RepID=A0A3D8JA21_9HELI|nr:AAA domain-containing protein [Helicobacter anseris]RDU74282.1 hypothetical protein CQA57_02035 [Helicobacter anseris]